MGRGDGRTTTPGGAHRRADGAAAGVTWEARRDTGENLRRFARFVS